MKSSSGPTSLFLIMILFLAFCFSSFAQEKPVTERSLKGIASKVKHLKIGRKKFKDLQALKENIGDSRIVLLGEESHSAGTTMKMKGRLIRFLHREMGFNVLAWESGVAGLHEVDKALMDPKKTSYEAAQKGIYDVWMRAKEFQPLLEYLKGTKKTKNPIFNIGFDTRLSGADTAKDLVVEMERFLNGGKKKYLDQETMDYLKSELGEDKGYYNILRSPERTEKMMKQFAEILTILSKNKKKLKKEYGKFAYKYFYLTIKAAHQGFSAYHMYGTGFEHFEESWNARDKSMAENISYIANELYPDEKIIIWAHSYHNANDGGQLENLQGVKEYEELITMGTHLYDEFGDDLYSIAFVSYDGAITSNGFKINIPLEDPPQGSLSWLFHEIGWKYGYLDLKHLPADHWLRNEKIKARFQAPTIEQAIWPNVCDAFIYIRTAEPKTPMDGFEPWN